MANTDGMDTISNVLDHLKLKGHDNEFTINKHGLVNLRGKIYLRSEMKIIKTYRFEGDSDPAEEAIIYIIKAYDGNIGYSLDGYGIYAVHTNDEFADIIKGLAKT
jgi:hypothetical protein